MFKRLFTVLAAMSFGLTSPAAGAEEMLNHTNYQIALSGLPLANAFFQTRKDGRTYAIDAQIASTGIGDIIADAKAEMSSAGAIRNDGFRPEKFSFRYRYGKKARSFETRFKGGNVVASIIEPPSKKKKGWIEVTPEDLRAVTDPIAGLIVPDGNEPCRSEISIYDGESRLSLKLARKRDDEFKTEGYTGAAIVCSVRYEPKSGYRRGRSDVEYARKLENMEIWFAKSTSLNVYAPVFLLVPTRYGTLTVTATHFDG
jgi:hypothetical protein